MQENQLRAALIRLARQKPEFRDHLLPLLREAGKERQNTKNPVEFNRSLKGKKVEVTNWRGRGEYPDGTVFTLTGNTSFLYAGRGHEYEALDPRGKMTWLDGTNVQPVKAASLRRTVESALSAEDAFDDAFSSCLGRLGELNKALRNTQKRFKSKYTGDNTRDWSYAGSLNEVDKQLSATLRFLRGF